MINGIVCLGHSREEEIGKSGRITWAEADSRKYDNSSSNAAVSDATESKFISALGKGYPGLDDLNKSTNQESRLVAMKEQNLLLVDKLIPNTTYLFRIKVRTVTGWSPWSDISNEMRTLSIP